MTADVRELVRLAEVLTLNLHHAERDMTAIVNRGALNIKNDWRTNARATAGQHGRIYPYSINYDLKAMPGGASAEIGPDKGLPQGALGNLLEFGSVNNPPHNDGGRALAKEEPLFQAQVESLADRLGRL